MSTLAARASLERPASDVFRFICTDHFKNHPRWDPRIVTIQGDTGPIFLGARAVLIRRIGPRRTREFCEVTEVDEPKKATFSSLVGPFVVHITADIAEDGPLRSQASLSYQVNAWGRARIACPLIGRVIRSNLRRSMRQIEELISSEAHEGG